MIHLSFDQAVSMLPPDDAIHSAAAASGSLIGCGLPRERVLALMGTSPSIWLASKDEALYGHRLLIRDPDRRYLWIELDDRNVRVTLEDLRRAGVELLDEPKVPLLVRVAIDRTEFVVRDVS